MRSAGNCEIPKGMLPPPSEIGTLGAYFQPTPFSQQKLVRSDERLVEKLVEVLDRQLVAAVDARSAAEFVEIRKRAMPRYVRGLRALQDTVSNLVTPQMLECISDSVTKELAEDLETQREARFGEKLTDQAIFTLWTLRNIRALAEEIVSADKPPEEKRQADNALKHEYVMASLWAQFHLDVLFAAVKLDRPICDEIRDELCDGLRAAVDAFVIMKDALALRQPKQTEDVTPLNLPWDGEDERLLASSMRDLNARSAKG
jgi:hypothetical protein